VIKRLPKGAAVVYRTFGAPGAEVMAKRLRTVTRARGIRLLIGADHGLALRVAADGVHLPERLSHRILELRRRQPGWLISVAAHSRAAVRHGRGADAIILSAVFPSRSPSAGPALGPLRFAQLVRASRAPVIALGGVNAKNAPRLISTGAAGLAAIDGLIGPD